jgi:hypothetical protein
MSTTNFCNASSAGIISSKSYSVAMTGLMWGADVKAAHSATAVWTSQFGRGLLTYYNVCNIDVSKVCGCNVGVLGMEGVLQMKALSICRRIFGPRS